MKIKTQIKFFLFILVSIILISACSSILTIGTSAIITSAWNDSRTIGTQLDDNILKIHIYQTLNKHSQIKKFSRIINIVYQGNVLLLGQSLSTDLSNQVVKIIINIKGTKTIYNAIRQQYPLSIQDIFIDSWISNQIRLKFIMQKNIHIANLKVITENKEVFLLGTVTHTEGRLAEDLAKTTKNIKNVFSIFTYK